MNSTPFRLPIRSLLPQCERAAQRSIPRRCITTKSAQNIPPDYNPALPAKMRTGLDGTPYPLLPEHFYLKKYLRQEAIPHAYLTHSTSELLPQSEKAQREKVQPHKRIVGVVVSHGKMQKTVKVRIAGLTYNKHIGKDYKSHTNHLVHDPNSSLVTGDVVELHRLRVSKTVRHVVASIISPFGTPIESRPPIPTPDDRLALYKQHRIAKLGRRTKRRAQEARKPTSGANPIAPKEPQVQ